MPSAEDLPNIGTIERKIPLPPPATTLDEALANLHDCATAYCHAYTKMLDGTDYDNERGNTFMWAGATMQAASEVHRLSYEGDDGA